MKREWPMNKQFNHKGYSGSCEVSIDDECLHGRLLFINDIIAYEGNTIQELKESFIVAVDNYIKYCAETGKFPNKPFSGCFNVRIPAALHKAVALRAMADDVALNDVVVRALDAFVNTREDINHNVRLTVDILENSRETLVSNASLTTTQWKVPNARH